MARRPSNAASQGRIDALASSKGFKALLLLLGGAAVIVILVGLSVTFLETKEAKTSLNDKSVQIRLANGTLESVRDYKREMVSRLKAGNATKRRLSRDECLDLRERYDVRPGRSWGRLDKAGQARWLELACDQYLCEPHRQRGRGVYDCAPLPDTNPSSRM